jgi:hypothetical protein
MSPSEILQNSANSPDIVPCVVLAFNRPDKLQRILEALRPQNLDRLIVFVDGPRNEKDAEPVEQCRAIARNVDWVDKELVLRDHNRGLGSLSENMSAVMESHKAAVFVEDDCLPMPGFYSFMRQALGHYEPQKTVFSIGGYQTVTSDFFANYPYSLVSSARFWCWGWSTWHDRWKAMAPLLPRYLELFGGWRNVPQAAGPELPWMVRACEEGQESSWDINVAVCMLWLQQVQLLPTRGLVRNIGLESGSHGAAGGGMERMQIFNRNVWEYQLNDIVWLPDIETNKEYATEYRKFATLAFTSNPSMTVLQIVKSGMRLAAQRRFRQLVQSSARLLVRRLGRWFGRDGSE